MAGHDHLHPSGARRGEPVGLAETDDGRCVVLYGPIEPGVIDHRADRLRQPKPPAGGPVDNPRGFPPKPTGPTTTTEPMNKPGKL